MMIESARMQAVQAPIISVVGDLIQQHPGTISLGQGVAYYGPPSEAIASLSDFLAQPNNHKYNAVEGMVALRKEIAAKLQAENGIVLGENSNFKLQTSNSIQPLTPNPQDPTANALVVTAGSNMAFLNAVLAIADPEDEIILQVPYYFNHEMAIRIANCRPVLVNTDDTYQLRPEAIRAAITPRTRAIVTISPNNPTGAVYSEAALREVNAICGDRGIYHISDETYEYFTYDGVNHFSPGSIPNSGSHTISLYSLSKAYGFASWRIGYMVIPVHLMAAVKKIQDTNLICPPVVSQYAALGALQAGAAYCKEKMGAIAQVRQILLRELDTIRDICAIPPADGAFYVLLRVHTDLPAFDLVERLIKDHKVAVIPGDTFGLESDCYLRVAYGALQHDTAAEGIGRLVRGLRATVG
jgi:aspartate/methionine/tyrosine aminotransferase